MSDRLSRGPFQVVTNDALEINDALRQIRQELDQIQGLNGRARIYDRLAVGEPTNTDDAAQFGNLPSGPVLLTGTQTLTGAKTIKGVALRFTDATNTLIHAFGAKV